MTLLIATVAKSQPSKCHVVITADGRCTGQVGPFRKILSDSYQKIFPIPGASIAIAHHGENVLSGVPVKDVLESFFAEHATPGTATVEQITDALGRFVEQPIRQTLQQIPASEVVGFWIAGFGHCRRKPILNEICWSKEPRDGMVSFESKSYRDLVLGGNAQHFVNQYCKRPVDGMYCWDQIGKKDIRYARRFHSKLYALAETAQEGDEIFGGRQHQLVITAAKGCEWSIPIEATAATEQPRKPVSE